MFAALLMSRRSLKAAFLTVPFGTLEYRRTQETDRRLHRLHREYRIDSVLGKGAMGVVYKAFDPGSRARWPSRPCARTWSTPRWSSNRWPVSRTKRGRPGGCCIRTSSACTSTARTTPTRSSSWNTSRAPGFAISSIAARSSIWRRSRRSHPALAGAGLYPRGVIHRDIKPANLILTEAGTLGKSPISASHASDTSSSDIVGMVMGTPLTCRRSNARDDEWSTVAPIFSALPSCSTSSLAAQKPFSGARDHRLQDLS